MFNVRALCSSEERTVCESQRLLQAALKGEQMKRSMIEKIIQTILAIGSLTIAFTVAATSMESTISSVPRAIACSSASGACQKS